MVQKKIFYVITNEERAVSRVRDPPLQHLITKLFCGPFESVISGYLKPMLIAFSCTSCLLLTVDVPGKNFLSSRRRLFSIRGMKGNR